MRLLTSYSELQKGKGDEDTKQQKKDEEQAKCGTIYSGVISLQETAEGKEGGKP